MEGCCSHDHDCEDEQCGGTSLHGYIDTTKVRLMPYTYDLCQSFGGANLLVGGLPDEHIAIRAQTCPTTVFTNTYTEHLQKEKKKERNPQIGSPLNRIGPPGIRRATSKFGVQRAGTLWVG
eukprot:2191015-Pyramimonas_sp.AAC.1